MPPPRSVSTGSTSASSALGAERRRRAAARRTRSIASSSRRPRDRLDEVVERRELERVDRGVVERADEDDRGRALEAAQHARELEPVEPGHAHVEEQRVERGRAPRRARRAPRPPTPRASTRADQRRGAQHPHEVLERRAARRRPRAARGPSAHPGAHPGAELRQRHHDGRPRRRSRPRARSPRRTCSAAARARCPARCPVRARRAPRRRARRRSRPRRRTRAARRRRRGRGPRSTPARPPARDSTPWRTAFSTERLERQHGHDRVQHLRVDLHAHAQPLAEARLLEPQVLLDVLQLVGQRHVRPLARERVADELGELDQQLARLLRARVDERGDGGERVVDEVRRDLRAQRPQLGAGEPLALRLDLGQLDHRRDERGGLGDDARLLEPHAARALVERDEHADPALAHRERRDDRRAQRAARVRAGQPRLDVHALVAVGADEPLERVAGAVVVGAGAGEREQRVRRRRARRRRRR